MGDTQISPPSMMDSQVAAISAKIMVTAMIVLFFIVAFSFFLCLYAKWYWSREESLVASWRGRIARQGTVEVRQRRGLDSHKLQSLPVVVYDPKEFKEGLECSVCLSEISEGEKVRVLPKCNHGFHLECIDMWFKSHSTCPLCRSSLISPKNQPIVSNQELREVVGASHVSSDSDSDSDSEMNSTVHSREVSPLFPTNVLIWGNEAPDSSLGEGSGSSSRQMGELVIEIPRYLFDDSLESAPSTNRVREDEVKTPVVSRLGSLKRMLSRGKRVAPSTSGDVESV